MTILAIAGARAARKTLFSNRPSRITNNKKGSQKRHAARYLSMFCVHRSINPARYLMTIGPAVQRTNPAITAAVACISNLRPFMVYLPISLLDSDG
jgi:hypothetical protein